MKRSIVMCIALAIFLSACKSNGANELQSYSTNSFSESHSHSYIQSVVTPSCTNSGYTINTCACGQSYYSDEQAPQGHNWTVASCTEPRICSTCGIAEGGAIGHSWEDATCTSPKKCTSCGETQGEPNKHEWMTSGQCHLCNTKNTEYEQEYNKLTEQYNIKIDELNNQKAALYDNISASYEEIATLEGQIIDLQRKKNSFIDERTQEYLDARYNSYQAHQLAIEVWDRHYAHFYAKYEGQITQEYAYINTYYAEIINIDYQIELATSQHNRDVAQLQKDILGI